MIGATALAVTLTLLAWGPVETASGADTTRNHLNWTEGSFEASLFGFGKHMIPEGVPAPDHERIPFEVNPCHRDLGIDLKFEPEEARVGIEANGTEASAAYSYRFQAGLIAPNETVVDRFEIDEPFPDHTHPRVRVDEPGEYVLELELLDGAAVHWEVRIRGFAIENTEPTCDLWLNEVELNPPTEDLQGEQWVEVYNENDDPFDLSGWTITGERSGNDHEIPDDTWVDGGAYQVIQLGEDALATKNETVNLVPPVGNVLDASPTISDEQPSDGSHQRCPDATRAWGFTQATPGDPNPESC